MEYSSAEMTCVLKLNTQCETCKGKVMQILKNLTGVYSITIDGEQGTVKVTGRVNPNSLMEVLEENGRHGELKYVRFDGEIRHRSQSYNNYGQHEFDPYGIMMHSTYPPFGCPQPHWHPTSLGSFPPLAPPPLGPPPPPFPPEAPFWAAPPFPPPSVPLWARPPPWRQ